MNPLLLRPWDEADAPALREAIDEDVDHLKPWLSWTLEEPASLERTRERLRSWAEEYRSERGLRWAITPADDLSRILGGANLNFRMGPRAHDIGYWVRKSAARRGVATAAVSRLVVHAFQDRKVKRLVARSDVANSASAAFARALGFEPARGATMSYPDGAPRRVSRFEMTLEGYRTHQETLRRRARSVQLVTDETRGWRGG